MKNETKVYYTNTLGFAWEPNTVSQVSNDFTWSQEVRQSIERNGYYRDSWGIVWSQASLIIV